MRRALTEIELNGIHAALAIATKAYEADAKNMGAQSGTLEAPLSATYKRLADGFTAKVVETQELIKLLTGSTVTVDAGDPDGL